MSFGELRIADGDGSPSQISVAAKSAHPLRALSGPLGASGALPQRCPPLPGTDPHVVDALEAAFDGLWLLDLTTGTADWLSPKLMATLGYGAGTSERPQADPQAVVFAEDRDTACTLLQSQRAPHPFEQLVRLRAASGGTAAARCRIMPLPGATVGAKKALALATMVPFLSAGEDRASFDTMLEVSRDAVSAWSTATGILRWNEGAHKLYGLDVGAVAGRFLHEMLPPTVAGGWDLVNLALKETGHWRGEVTWPVTHRERLVTSTSIQRIADAAGGTLYLQIDRDITREVDARANSELVIRELSHRLKNVFAVNLALVSASGRGLKDCNGCLADLRRRMEAVATAQCISLGDGAVGSASANDLMRLVTVIAAPYAPTTRQLLLVGPPLALAPTAAMSLGLILNELATNAAKYGAWSDEVGTVAVSWTSDPAANSLTLTWTERPSTPVATNSNKTGFGTTLIDSASRQLGGRYLRTLDASGLTVTVATDRLPSD